MKFISEKDNKWHNPKEELPPITTDVEFIDLSDNIRNGTIVVEMSGFYLHIRGKGWDSIDNIKRWRFV
jgi:hypothetical protein